jgi:hypothetical protein
MLCWGGLVMGNIGLWRYVVVFGGGGRGCDDCAGWPHGCRRCLGELLGLEGVGKGLSVGLLAVYVG